MFRVEINTVHLTGIMHIPTWLLCSGNSVTSVILGSLSSTFGVHHCKLFYNFMLRHYFVVIVSGRIYVYQRQPNIKNAETYYNFTEAFFIRKKNILSKNNRFDIGHGILYGRIGCRWFKNESLKYDY